MSELIDSNRRLLLKNILVLAGATSTASISVSALAEVVRSGRKFLDQSSYATLIAVADTLIPVTDTPGAVAADVPPNLDALLLDWAAPDTRQMVVDALARIEAAAQSAQQKPFAAFEAGEREEWLIEYDKAALKQVPLPENAPKGSPFAPQVSVADPGYHRIKDLVISLYYVSDIALTQELIYEHIPGAWVPSLKITPGMRPFASVGMI